jgi:hypothetical protein
MEFKNKEKYLKICTTLCLLPLFNLKYVQFTYACIHSSLRINVHFSIEAESCHRKHFIVLRGIVQNSIWYPIKAFVSTLYKAIIKPVWTCGIELCGCRKPSNTKILQTFQSKTLRNLTNAPWYISNVTSHNDLSIPHVTEVIRTYAKNHKNWIAQNNKQLIRDLFNQPEIGRRLNRMWSEDLIR